MAVFQENAGHTRSVTGRAPYDASAQFFTYLDDIMPKGSELSAVVGLTGPGSFTSLRTGLAALHGIALAKNIPSVGISCFKGYCLTLKIVEKSLILIESQREDLYAQSCDASGLIGEPFTCSLEEAKAKGLPLFGNAVDPEDLPHLEQVGEYALKILGTDAEKNHPLLPVYGGAAHTT